MASNITRTHTPEERELASKKADLAALETQLAQRELDFTTLRVEFAALLKVEPLAKRRCQSVALEQAWAAGPP